MGGWGDCMIQGAQSWRRLKGIKDIYYFRAPSENFSGGPESLLCQPCWRGIYHSGKRPPAAKTR